jgi:DNA polymerase-1
MESRYIEAAVSGILIERTKRSSERSSRSAPAAAKRLALIARPSARRLLLVIDGDSFAHRAYHALPKTIRRDRNRPAGAILGFANMLLRLYQAEQPRAVLVGWDTLDAPTYRHAAFTAYQSGRQFDDELIEQLAVIPQFVRACGFANAKAAGYEADDFLSAAVAREEKRGGTVLVASGDRDAFQLASDRTTILYPVRAGELARIGPRDVRDRYGVDPKQVPDFIAIRGDPSDRLPGLPGVGATGAATLLRRYGSSMRCSRPAASPRMRNNCLPRTRICEGGGLRATIGPSFSGLLTRARPATCA